MMAMHAWKLEKTRRLPAIGAAGVSTMFFFTLVGVLTMTDRAFLATLMGLMLLLVPVVSMLFNRWCSKRIEVIDVCFPSHHADEEGQVVVTLKNHLPLLINDITVACGPAEKSVVLLPHQTAQVAMRVAAHQRTRGEHPVDGLKITTAFPFGILKTIRHFVSTQRLVVFPSVESAAPAWPVAWERGSKRGREGEEAIGLKDYEKGDSLRSVDWKASARTRRLVVRQFETLEPQSVFFTWSQVESLGVEKGLERLTAWILKAHQMGWTYGLEVGGQTWAPSKSQQHLEACLAALARYRQPVGESLA